MNKPKYALSWKIAVAALLSISSARAEGPGGFVPGLQPSDGMLYSVNNATGELITINPNTAAIGVIGPVGFGSIEGLTYHAPSDTLFAVENDSNQLIMIDRQTGAGAAIGPTGRDFVFGLTYSEHNDTLYAVDTELNELLTLNPATGAATTSNGLGFDFVGGLTDNPETGVLYGVDYGTDDVFVMDLEAGLVGPIVEIASSSLQGVAYDQTTNDLFAISIEVGPEDLLRIDPLTDAVTVVGTLDAVAVASLAFVPNAIPEPSSMVALTLGMLCSLGRRPGRPKAQRFGSRPLK